MPKPDPIDGELFVHFKQGDDFAAHLERAKNDVSQALQAWGRELARRGAMLRRMAKLTVGTKLKVQADGNFIMITGATAGDRAVMTKLLDAKYVDKPQFDEED